MSKAELELLRELGIPQKEVATALDVSAQRVSQGLNDPEWYLTPARLRDLYHYLEIKDPAKAEAFRSRAIESLPLAAQGEALRERVIPVTGDPIIDSMDTSHAWDDVEEIWVFSAKPLELEKLEYLEEMERSFFRLTGGKKIRRIVYFVSPSSTDRLIRYFSYSFRSIPLEERVEVVIVESPSISICPKFVIFDAMTANPRALVLADISPDKYVNLPAGHVHDIIDGLRDAGIGGRREKTFLIVPPLENLATDSLKHPIFRIRFSSLEAIS